jgi:uncharacterized protein YjbI with pentapeptide repeats
LSEASFKHARLKSTCFVNAKLGDADFRGAHIIDCDFSGAELIETKFQGVDLSSVKNISAEELESSVIDSKTKIPDYIEINWTSEDTYDCKLV